MAKFEIDYDKEFDDLYLYRKDKKAEVSLNLGNFVIDAKKTGMLVGFEVLNASQTLSHLLREKVTKSRLSEMKNVAVFVNAQGNSLFISVIAKTKPKDEMIIPLVVPAIN